MSREPFRILDCFGTVAAVGSHLLRLAGSPVTQEIS